MTESICEVRTRICAPAEERHQRLRESARIIKILDLGPQRSPSKSLGKSLRKSQERAYERRTHYHSHTHSRATANKPSGNIDFARAACAMPTSGRPIRSQPRDRMVPSHWSDMRAHSLHCALLLIQHPRLCFLIAAPRILQHRRIVELARRESSFAIEPRSPSLHLRLGIHCTRSYWRAELMAACIRLVMLARDFGPDVVRSLLR